MFIKIFNTIPPEVFFRESAKFLWAAKAYIVALAICFLISIYPLYRKHQHSHQGIFIMVLFLVLF